MAPGQQPLAAPSTLTTVFPPLTDAGAFFDEDELEAHHFDTHCPGNSSSNLGAVGAAARNGYERSESVD